MVVENFKKIVKKRHFEEIEEDKPGTFTNPASPEKIAQILELLGERLPKDFLELYEFSDGQTEGMGIFFGDGFMTTEKIISELNFAKRNAKPKYPYVKNPSFSNLVIDKIVAHYLTLAPKKRLLKQPIWEKMEFEVSPNSIGGPYLYRKGTSSSEREVLKTTDVFKKKSFSLAKEIYKYEESSYNWDSLNVTVWANGQYDVEREIYNFTSNMTSTPKNYIKIEYFNPKWLPIFEDFSGNFIGIDFDPDKEGIKGQVIIYGRDEEDMIVLANSLSEFFNKVIAWQASPETEVILENEFHIHDVLRKLVKD